MKNLAYIGKIIEITPIEGADFIVSATVVCGIGGKWIGVIQKDKLKVGDLVEVYLQDAILPEIERYEFLRNVQFRIRMRKFKGVPSECLIMPLEVEDEVIIGTDITESKHVKKYIKELPANLSGIALGLFPSNLFPKTDEPNFQKVDYMIEALQGNTYYSTVKADGSSGTIYRNGDHFGCCSRNLEFKPSDKTAVWGVAKNYDLENKLPEGYAIQFELCGPGIQKNRLGLKNIDGFIFNVWDINQRTYLDAKDVVQFAKTINMPTVEIEDWNKIFYITDLNLLREKAEGVYKSSGKTREGLVFRPMKEQVVNGERLSFKVINLMFKD